MAGGRSPSADAGWGRRSEPGHLVDPDAGGVDDDRGLDLDVAAVGPDGGAGHPSRGPPEDPGEGGVVGDGGAVQEGGGAGHRQRQPGVVDVGVVVQVGPGEPSGPQGGHAGEGVVGGDLLVDVADAEPAGQVVGPEGGADAPRRGPAAVDGEHERHPPDQVGGVPEQPLALGQGLGDEPELPLVEVPQAAVDQLGRLRRRPRGEVVALDQGRAQSPGGGVEGHARAGDAPADHQDVEGLGRHPVERGGAVELARRGPRGHVRRVTAVAAVAASLL